MTRVGGDIRSVPATGGAFTGQVDATAFKATGGQAGLTAARFMGLKATAGWPTSGTFAVGDYVIDSLGRIWICVTAGTSGEWVTASGTLLKLTPKSATQTGLNAVATGGAAANTGGDVSDLVDFTFAAPAQDVIAEVVLHSVLQTTSGQASVIYLCDASDNELTRWKLPTTSANNAVGSCNIRFHLDLSAVAFAADVTLNVRAGVVGGGSTTIAANSGGTVNRCGHLAVYAA